jgi:hypothetical protein
MILDSAVTSTSSSPTPPLKVVVIHGDPTKPNDILPGGKWDEDDFESLARAREALETLNGYAFTWLCNHDTLFDDLRRLKASGDIDLVLQVCLVHHGICAYRRIVVRRGIHE